MKDTSALTRALEMVALLGFPFQVIEEDENFIELFSSEYPVDYPLFALKNMVGSSCKIERKMPSISKIQKRLHGLLDVPYVWGGNWHRGFPDHFEKHFSGVDCTGLLYEVTNGLTPRNSSWFFEYGFEVSHRNLKPLDLIVHKGHLIIVYDKKNTIESNFEWGGVKMMGIEKRLGLLNQKEIAFTCRRFL